MSRASESLPVLMYIFWQGFITEHCRYLNGHADQCCGSESFHYGSDSLMSSGSGSYLQKVSDPVSDPTFFMKKYDFKGPKMAFQNIIFKEYPYLHLVPVYIKMMKLLLFLTVFVNVSIWTRIRIQNPGVTNPNPAKVPDPCGSGSTTLTQTRC
jgi:hypothetical protein